jgi:uncharacterized protein with PhoU and TrkA domain
MVWPIVEDLDLHPVLAMALGESDVVVARVPIAQGSTADGASIAGLQLEIEPGFHVLAVVRDGRHIYRPRGYFAFEAGDELIATGPQEGRARLAELCGWRMIEDDDDDPTGEVELVPLGATRR